MSAKLLLVVLVGLIAALEVSCGKKYVIDGLDDVYESPDPIETPEAGAASGAGELKVEGPDDILNFVEIDDQWFYTTRNALLSLEIPANVEITKEVLERAFDKAAKKNVRFELIKRTLLNLNEWRDCSSEVADSFLPILRLKELQRFRSFFESYWWEKFRKCEKHATPLVIRDLNGISAYKALKEFLSAAMDLQEDIEATALSDAEYYATLRDVDLNDGKYKNEASIAVAQKYKPDWEQWDAKGDSVEVDDDVKYVKFLTKKCYLAFNNQHTQFALINLTKRFEQANGADLESNGMPFNILNEWRRICLGWLKGGDDERKALMAKSIDEKLRGKILNIKVYDVNHRV